MPGKLSDDEIRQRLEAHNYNVPAITDTTRSVLVKKLRQLDQQAVKSKAPSIDYSSAEEDFLPSTTSTRKNMGSVRTSRSKPYLQRNGSSSNTYKTRVDTGYSGASRGGTTPVYTSTASPIRHHNGFSLVNQSDDDEEEEEEDEESDEESGAESDDKLDDYEQQITSVPRADLACQTSFNSSNEQHHDNETRFRGKTLPGCGVASVNTGAGTTSPYTIRSQHLRQNINKFGSLDEALATLPSNRVPVTSSPPASRHQSLVHQATPTPAQLSNRSNVSHYGQPYSGSRAKTWNNSILISSLIVGCAALFFAYLGYRYFTLSPSLQHSNRLTLCTGSGQEKVNIECIPGHQLNRTAELLTTLLSAIKEEKGESCPADTTSADVLTVQNLQNKFVAEDAAEFESLLQNVIILIKQNPAWGLQPVYEDDEITSVVSVENKFDFYCKLLYITHQLFTIVYQAANYIISIMVITIVSWLFFLTVRYYRRRKHEKEQEMFELVERVVLMLQDNHADKDETAGAPSYLAINHIRDQLIAPQDRAGKAKVWDSVIKYIQKNESRVREEVQHIHGEEFRVWQWLPSLPSSASPYNTSPIKIYQGRVHNPFYGRGHAHTSTPLSPAQRPQPGFSPAKKPLSPHKQEANKKDSWPFTPTTTAGSPGWQGSAFQLNRNVSAPAHPPTNCIKARHMFTPNTLTQEGLGAIKNDIVFRCADAKILHIAVDKESKEGIVYMKAASDEDAGRVFNSIHGQWYKGNLVTAKYLRQDRYHQRFPESVHTHTPLK